MCIIVVKERGVDFPTEKILDNCQKKNDDGVGIAYKLKDVEGVCIKKNFKKHKKFKRWLRNMKESIESCIIHYRIATSGLVDYGNRHPFPITNNFNLMRQGELVCDRAFAHNGVMTQFSYDKSKYSDTMKFNSDILSYVTGHWDMRTQDSQDYIESFLKGDKLAILFNNGDIIKLGNFNEDAGLYYSNFGFEDWNYKTYATKYSNYTTFGYKGGEEEIEEVPSVGTMKEINTDYDKEYCEYCEEEIYLNYDVYHKCFSYSKHFFYACDECFKRNMGSGDSHSSLRVDGTTLSVDEPQLELPNHTTQEEGYISPLELKELGVGS